MGASSNRKVAGSVPWVVQVQVQVINKSTLLNEISGDNQNRECLQKRYGSSEDIHRTEA